MWARLGAIFMSDYITPVVRDDAKYIHRIYICTRVCSKVRWCMADDLSSPLYV